ncbi:hypothetical protein [Bifidobacterium catenulatum]|uniref:hypothetical protein n=1 Tax=Bifidobacterium TaxID=1678 RepID=UPI0012AC3D5A|nr:hypothetical protein [Bifidobacterium catenulatum]
MEHILNLHMRAAETVLDAVDEAAGSQGHVSLPYHRSQTHCDKYGSGRGDYRPVDAHAREVAAVLESRDIEPRFHYPRG